MGNDSITLRPLELEDLDQLFLWRNDPAVGRHLARLTVTREHLLVWFRSLRPDCGDRAYAVLHDGAFVGYATLSNGDPANRKCEAGVVIGDPEQWGKGLATEVVRRLSRIAFTELGMHRILCVASERNPGSIHCFRNAGFVEEGRLRHATLRDGEFIDLVLLSLLEPEWRGALVSHD